MGKESEKDLKHLQTKRQVSPLRLGRKEGRGRGRRKESIRCNTIVGLFSKAHRESSSQILPSVTFHILQAEFSLAGSNYRKCGCITDRNFRMQPLGLLPILRLSRRPNRCLSMVAVVVVCLCSYA